MKEYAGGGSSKLRAVFWIQAVCSSRNAIECAFACLKRAIDINLNDLPDVIHASFVVHNYCELNNESINEVIVRKLLCFSDTFIIMKQPNDQTNCK